MVSIKPKQSLDHATVMILAAKWYGVSLNELKTYKIPTYFRILHLWRLENERLNKSNQQRK
jgi:hypothetical protein